MRRKSIEVSGLHHGQAAIPQASLVGPLLISSGINGIDADTGNLPDTVDEQIALIFTNIEKIMEAAGGTTADIAKCTFFVRDRAARSAIDPHWLQMFPDEASRSARHTLQYALPVPLHTQCELIAYLDAATVQSPKG
jgi:enamine deaminase RidA (YjgF/YER057c/UK114 family)